LIKDKAKGDWNKAAMLINNDEGARHINDKDRRIMRAGNQALHPKKEAKISRLVNELNAMIVLQDLRDILKFIYR
jgi:hypothetical protein